MSVYETRPFIADQRGERGLTRPCTWWKTIIEFSIDGETESAMTPRENKFFIDNIVVRIRFIIVLIRWTGRRGSLNSLYQVASIMIIQKKARSVERNMMGGWGLGFGVWFLGFGV